MQYFRWALALFVGTLGGCQTPVSSSPGWDDTRPSWTADGTHLIFSSNRDGNWELYRVASDGSGLENLTRSPHDELFPRVSPDGSRIAYVGVVDGNYDIYVCSIDGSGPVRLTDHPMLDDWPDWNGADLVFDSDRTGHWGIYTMTADGSAQTAVVDNPVKEGDPTASPGSSLIVFSRQEGDNRQLYSVDPDSGEERRLTDNAMTNAHPDLSNDGRFVAFNAGTDYWRLFVMTISGTDTVQLTSGEFDDKWPAWSPVGDRIAFTSNRDGRWKIHVIDANGQNRRAVTK